MENIKKLKNFIKTSPKTPTVVQNNVIKRSKPGSIQKRYILTVYCFFGYLICNLYKAILSIAILDMAKANKLSWNNATSRSYYLNKVFKTGIDSESNFKTLIFNIKNGEWSKKFQGHVLSSMFYGIIIVQLPSGSLKP